MHPRMTQTRGNIKSCNRILKLSFHVQCVEKLGTQMKMYLHPRMRRSLRLPRYLICFILLAMMAPTVLTTLAPTVLTTLAPALLTTLAPALVTTLPPVLLTILHPALLTTLPPALMTRVLPLLLTRMEPQGPPLALGSDLAGRGGRGPGLVSPNLPVDGQ